MGPSEMLPSVLSTSNVSVPLPSVPIHESHLLPLTIPGNSSSLIPSTVGGQDKGEGESFSLIPCGVNDDSSTYTYSNQFESDTQTNSDQVSRTYSDIQGEPDITDRIEATVDDLADLNPWE